MKEYHVKDGPFIKGKQTTNKIMRNLLIALIPIVLFSFYKNGIIPYIKDTTNILGLFYPLIFILVASITTILTETLYNKFIYKLTIKESIKKTKESYALFPGLFLALVLPINTPILILILGGIVASLVGKLLFGGFGKNIFNPALIGCLFVISAYSLVITNNGGYLNSYEVDTLSSATPLSNVALVDGIGTYDTLVKPYGSLTDFFIGTIPGSVGETSALLCLIGLIFLLSTRSIKGLIPITYIGTVFVLTFIIGSINGLGIWYPLFQILSGGLMFGAIFMATDPVTSPTTKYGALLYGLMLGLLTVIFRYLTPYPEGVMTAILTMNMLVFIIDKIGIKAKTNIYKSIPLVIITLICIGTSILIALPYKNIKPEVDNNYNIISKQINNQKVVYIATQKGYVGNIKAEITIENSKIISYKVIEQNESFYNKIENNNYINNLLNGQNNIENVDTVSGATVTSVALKKLLTNTLKDYQNNKNEEISKPVVDDRFEIVSKKQNKNSTIYNVNQTSFGGKSNLNITITNNKITNYQVVDCPDSYYDVVKNNKYTIFIVKNQDKLPNIDTVSGATITSNALKEAAYKVINKHKESTNE